LSAKVHRSVAVFSTGFGLAATAAAVALATGSAATVNSVQNSTLGKILVSTGGRTLYHDSSEAKNVVRCTGACAAIWPPLLVGAGTKPVAGPGVKAALLGTVKRDGGKLQITYSGLPLYLYSGDKRAGQVNGQGVGGFWHAIAPTGSVVMKVPSSAAGTTPSSSSGSKGSTSNSSSSSGYGSSSHSSTTSGSTSSADQAYCAANPMACFNGVPVG
jgi:predicted lipoprotein with Yx(FWY)xxD motif